MDLSPASTSTSGSSSSGFYSSTDEVSFYGDSPSSAMSTSLQPPLFPLQHQQMAPQFSGTTMNNQMMSFQSNQQSYCHYQQQNQQSALYHHQQSMTQYSTGPYNSVSVQHSSDEMLFMASSSNNGNNNCYPSMVDHTSMAQTSSNEYPMSMTLTYSQQQSNVCPFGSQQYQYGSHYSANLQACSCECSTPNNNYIDHYQVRPQLLANPQMPNVQGENQTAVNTQSDNLNEVIPIDAILPSNSPEWDSEQEIEIAPTDTIKVDLDRMDINRNPMSDNPVPGTSSNLAATTNDQTIEASKHPVSKAETCSTRLRKRGISLDTVASTIKQEKPNKQPRRPRISSKKSLIKITKDDQNELLLPTLDPSLDIFRNTEHFFKDDRYYPKLSVDYIPTKILDRIVGKSKTKYVCLYALSWQTEQQCEGCSKEIAEFQERVREKKKLELPFYHTLIGYAQKKDKFSQSGVLAVLGQQRKDNELMYLILWSTTCLTEEELKGRKDVRRNISWRNAVTDQDHTLLSDYEEMLSEQEQDSLDCNTRTNVELRRVHSPAHVEQFVRLRERQMTLVDVVLDTRLNVQVLGNTELYHELPPVYPDDSPKWLRHLYNDFAVYDANKGTLNITPIILKDGEKPLPPAYVEWLVQQSMYLFANDVPMKGPCALVTLNQTNSAAIVRHSDNVPFRFSAQKYMQSVQTREGGMKQNCILLKTSTPKEPYAVDLMMLNAKNVFNAREFKKHDKLMNEFDLTHFEYEV